jgi:hypothetical protein
MAIRGLFMIKWKVGKINLVPAAQSVAASHSHNFAFFLKLLKTVKYVKSIPTFSVNAIRIIYFRIIVKAPSMRRILPQITSLYFYFYWSSVNFICSDSPDNSNTIFYSRYRATKGSSCNGFLKKGF